MKHWLILMAAAAVAAMLPSCSNQVPAGRAVEYHFEPGRTALFRDGLAYAPKSAPAAVKRAIQAGNRLQNKPYKWGGGHRIHNDSGFDCSGSVSYVLREAGLLRGCLDSRSFLKYGKKGMGEWITVYVRNGHVFLTVAGLRLDTGGARVETGPRWKPCRRGVRGYVVRHPSGL
ncbi:MAG TPA: peptidoglycan endopeptidase [Luteolibacter sp.]|nr:peptidoglycan endopeptidase [Luteolibacter sp.]